MDEPVYVKRSQVKELVRRGAPNFNGNKVFIKTLTGDTFDPHDNYWSSGYRSYYTVVDLTNLKPLTIPDHNPFDGLPTAIHIAAHSVVVQHSYAGTKQSCTIWAREQDQGLSAFNPSVKPVLFVKP